MYDNDGSGELDWHELVKLFKDISKVVQDQTLINHMDQILKMIDKNGDGKLSKEEFLELFMNQRSSDSEL